MSKCSTIGKYLGGFLMLLNMPTSVLAQAPIDKDYVRSLAAPGKKVAVIEYYNGNGDVVNRRGFATEDKWIAKNSTEFQINSKSTLKLYGLKPCQGNLVVRNQEYAGTCEEYGHRELQVMLNDPKVILCRAFITEEQAPKQDVTCFGYYNIPGVLDSVENFEEQLVSIGALTVETAADGSLIRDDLADALRIGKKGFGMWTDSRHNKN